jgi:hypothetical protein
MGMTGLPPGEFSLISPGTKIPGQVTLNHGTGTMKFDRALGLATHGPGKPTEDKENPK